MKVLDELRARSRYGFFNICEAKAASDTDVVRAINDEPDYTEASN